MKTITLSLICATGLLCATATIASAQTVTTPEECLTWLSRSSEQMILSSARTMANGTTAYPPQVGIGYEAFWLRDYCYALEGCANIIPETNLINAVNTFTNAISTQGAGVDCVKFDGTPIYKPGYGSMGENPVADGSQFTVATTWLSWKATDSADLLSKDILDKLDLTMSAVPINPQTGLVHISDKTTWDRCPYGFTDTVRKQGDVLFESLLYHESAARLSEMMAAAGRTEDSTRYTNLAKSVKDQINEVFWDEENGLYNAATIQCKQGDIWGSAFAVYLGVADESKSIIIGNTLKEQYTGIVQNGQVRHTEAGTYWEVAGAKDTYQNGAYWGTASGWTAYAISKVDPALADSMIVDLVNYYQTNGIPEFSINGTNQLVGYLSSGALPITGIKLMLSQRGMSTEQNISPQNLILATFAGVDGTQASTMTMDNNVFASAGNANKVWIKRGYHGFGGYVADVQNNTLRTSANMGLASVIDSSSLGMVSIEAMMKMNDIKVNKAYPPLTFGLGLGFYDSQVGSGSGEAGLGFSGLILNPDGELTCFDSNYVQVGESIPFGGTFDPAKWTTMKMDVIFNDDGTATLVGLSISDSDADYSSLLGYRFKTTDMVGIFSRGSDWAEHGYIDNFKVENVPEPTSMALILAGLLGLLVIRRKATAKR